MASKAKTSYYKIHGLDCAEEVAVLKREVGPVVGGVERLTFDILNARMAVLPGPTAVAAEDVIRAVSATGMRAELWRGDAKPVDDTGWMRWRRMILTAASGMLGLLGLLVHAVSVPGGLLAALGSEGAGLASSSIPLGAVACYLAGIVAGTWLVLPKAWLAVRRLRPDINLLMVVAILGALAIGEWFEAATVSFLFALSLALEAWSVGRARRAIGALMDLTPTTVRMLRDGREIEVSPAAVSVGTRFVVRPADRIPLDGRVMRGASDVNQAPITGESVPAAKEVGDSVFAGTINGDGLLEVESTSAAQDTTLARIIRLVGEAQSKRSPSEQWVEKFARIYTPAVMGLALAGLLTLVIYHGPTWEKRKEWLYPPLVLLVIACPCALVISTPVSIVAALTAAARQGVLVKGGVHIETPAQLKAIAFDKTGTLTRGTPEVVELVPLNGHDETELLERAAALEANSNHPLARAVVKYAAERGVTPAPAENFQTIQGKGATARVDGREFWLGSHRYLEERGQETPEVHERLESLAASGKTVVVVGNETHVCGLIALADSVRPQSKNALSELRRAGITHLIMLTGDNQGTAKAIAEQTGVDEVRAELLPDDKVSAIEELVTKYHAVAMVGDGVNDAPAMGRATLGVAMGAAGSDAAIETADIALMSDDLSKLPWLIRHSRRTLSIIQQNIIFSLSVKALFVLLTFAGFASLWGAIAADAGASLLVVFNGLRLLKFSVPKLSGMPSE